jgi:hypothetical protein
MDNTNALPTAQEQQMASVSFVMGTKEETDQVYRTMHGKTFQNVALSEMMLANKLLQTREYGTASLKPTGVGIDMSMVQKPIRGADELAQILVEEASSVGQVSEEGRLQYDQVLNKGVNHSKAIDRINQSRKLNHDKAMKDYDQNVVDIAEELEQHVIEQCRYLRDDELIEIDIVIKNNLKLLDDDEKLKYMSHEDVLNIWKDTNISLLARKNYIEKYASFLMNIETMRSQQIGAALSTLAESIVGVGYLLRDEAIRLVESRKCKV